MAELEKTIEEKLIEQLTTGDSQWTYRPDLKDEAALWANLRAILENSNKAVLDGTPLSDREFEQVKNQLSFATFYDAAKWIGGENGVAHVAVQRENKTLQLTALKRDDIAGGTSVYEVINQYRSMCDEECDIHDQNRRFDVSLLINGIPLIHIELKNRQHSYLEGFRQIKKYVREGKFTGIFSAVQMFVVSNAVDTKYFAAAGEDQLNEKFLFGWADADNNPVADYLKFSAEVLRIPEAHQMVMKYAVLDQDDRRILLLRPYQIHAIEAIRAASRQGQCGYIWHTTGSGKTMTSYKAARNLLIDIPSIEKTIFLIDRKDLDNQTTQAFQSYANNDVIDVDETDNVTDLINKLKNQNQQVIVTTIQKLSIAIKKRIDYDYIVSLIQAVVSASEGERNEQHYQNLMDEIEKYIDELMNTNPKLGALLKELWENIKKNPEEFKDKKVSHILEAMRKEAMNNILTAFAAEWCVSIEAITYSADHYVSGDSEIPALNNLKKTADFDRYSESHSGISKFKYHQEMKKALIQLLNQEIIPLRDDSYRVD